MNIGQGKISKRPPLFGQILLEQGKIKLSAQNIELSSTAETKITAQGGATLDGSPGTTTVKGSTVNIN